jgi:molecular chaperone DnaK (HSP70)
MIIGIDIGTSFSSVAILKDGKAKEVKAGTDKEYSVPSAVYAQKNGELLIGQAAIARRVQDTLRFKKEFKRDFGTEKPYLLVDCDVTPDEIYIEYFKLFKKSVEDAAGVSVSKAYITHPVGYSRMKKMMLEKSAKYAGLINVELIDEPTAAALSYFSDHMPKKG